MRADSVERSHYFIRFCPALSSFHPLSGEFSPENSTLEANPGRNLRPVGTRTNGQRVSHKELIIHLLTCRHTPHRESEFMTGPQTGTTALPDVSNLDWWY